jgi:hypothetical protein
MSVTLSPLAGAGWQFFDNNGIPLAGGLLYTYAAGTTTPLTTYTTFSGNIAQANPIVLDSAGRLSNELWITVGYGYKFVLKDATGVQIGSWDNIPSNAASPFANDANSIAYEQGATVTAGAFIVGAQYQILTVGTTNFVALGATSNTVGVYFTATGVGSGTGTANLSRSVESKLQDSVSVKDFGAVGDGTANDTVAFVAAAAYITAQSGGKLIVPAGTYLVGSQVFAGATGKGYSYQGTNVLYINGCTKPVVIEFQGAVMKLAAGLRIGSFNPVTGASYTPGSLPFVDYDYRADPGCLIFLNNNANVTICGSVELDGNSSNLVVGGQWGDAGYQCTAYGILSYGCDILNISNVYSHHQGLDGVAIGYTGLTETSPLKPTTLTNVVCEYNSRQGLSVVGANGLTVIGCKFNNTGKGAFSSGPGAGVDLEAESAVIRQVSFVDCEMVNNAGVGVVADSGDISGVTFIRCKFIGTTSWAIWPHKPRMAFYDCLMVGSSVNAYSSATNPDDATKFFNCKFTDQNSLSPTGATYDSGFVVQFDTVPNVLLENCTIVATKQQACLISFGAYVKNTRLIVSAGTTYIANQGQAASFESSTIENLLVYDQIVTNIPTDAIFIYLSNTKFFGTNYLSSASGKIKWWSWSAGAGGATGYLGQNSPTNRPFSAISLAKGLGADLIGYYGTILIVAGTAAPTTGTWAVGDRCINSTPVVGQPKGWACTVAGTPGTWVSEGNL